MDTLPIISMEDIHKLSESKKVVESFHTYGIIIVRDSRVNEEDNMCFLDTMEKYFEQTDENKKKDSRPKQFYQVGVTPSFIEQPRNHCKNIIPGIDRPVTLCPPSKDAKWRYFWKIGERPTHTQFPELNAEQVIPELFKDTWAHTMNTWGNKLFDSVWDISGALARGLELPENSFQERMLRGPHLLAPTGTDLKRFGGLHTVMAGYHYDLNFITCHGKSKFPGLYIWLRNGKRVPVHIPDGCLLMQAGKQLEWLTGGYIKAGFHEVVVSKNTKKVIHDKIQRGESLWRISSTFFSHIRSDTWLEPLIDSEERPSYPRIKAGKQVQQELEAIDLK